MLLEGYNKNGFLSIISVLGETSEAGKFAFRGDLTLKKGGFREGSDVDRKPPEYVIQQAIILESDDKLIFVSGLLTELSTLKIFLDEYKSDITPETVFLFYVGNIAENIKVEYEGSTFQLVAYDQGMIWNELLELLYIEKSDLKGQSAEDKVITVFDEAKSFAIKKEVISLEAALEKTIVVKKSSSVGAI
ncbi:hypothetical protein AU255_12585 [Methyloprofundus sedimenti]|uniref:Uncharacterized protein n=1 Tax=Methyloprofundus sedimenti TaxID=1420851 RepID=A0A1V8MAL3_9GAMM|nr:hypothetical protein [Methyloprofundus sedimenti]OQK18609.1 hypothetical protein AU255_12585 [Methyloprofundus sedimenti]